MKSSAVSVAGYLAGLPADRRAAISAVRAVMLENLPEGYVECMAWGLIGYVIPLARFGETYNGMPLMIAGLGSQKNYMAVYLMCIYGDKKLREWFEKGYKAAGKKLDAGKCCVRFKRLEDLPLALIGEAIGKVPVEKLIEMHECVHAPRRVKRGGTLARKGKPLRGQQRG